MEYIEAKDSVVIFSKRMGLSTISHKLADLSGEQINGFFLSRKIRLPRKLHAMAMVGALNDRIKELDSHSLSRDAFSKLSFYPNFTEYQLQLLFERIGTEDDFAKYREYLWKLIIRNFEAIHLMDGEAQYLINVRKQKMNDFKTYAKYINQCSMDIENEFDASPLMNLESTLKNSYSQDDIRKLGKKYGIIISNRLKKEELVDYVKMIMKSKKKLTEELEKELDEMTVVQLNSFCTLHQIELSAVLKKNELIYLFLFLLRQTDLDVLPINDLIGYDFAEPLEFSVDLSVVDAFGRGEPNKNVIILPETEDEPEEEPETEDEPEEEPETEEEPEEEPETEEEPEEEPVVEEEPEEEPVVEEEPEEEPVAEEEPEEEPVVEEEPEEEPVAEEEPEEEPVVEEEPEEEPVAEEEPEEEPVAEEEPEEEPETEEEPEKEPVAEEEPKEEPVAEEEPEEEVDSEDDLDDLDDLDDIDEEDDLEALDNMDTLSNLDEGGNSLNEEPENQLENESYDEEFVNSLESNPEDINEDGIESPYYRNKKLESKKKNVILTCILVGGIVAVLASLFLVIHFLG